MNTSDCTPNFDFLVKIFSIFGQENRLKILLVIGNGHACVCHLEEVLGLRQAYISQQLTLMRLLGLLTTERIGKHIFYHIADPRWLTLIQDAANIAGVNLPQYHMPEVPGCEYQIEK